ncbi:hypothetical protein ACFQ08_02420 [Streptosporangium algeriense]|uniref:Ribbon-helix-helix protein CopG domain-containing protein n=1 Tax=Streptosporangium algeriense TaxID=1682748 RepID=A0ABW3DI65_9ACTN
MTDSGQLGAPGGLGAAFGGSAAGGLGGILPPKPPGAPPASPVPRSAAPAPTTVSAPPPQADSDEFDDATYPVAVYLLPSAIQAAAAYRTKTQVDSATVVYDAIDAVRDQLGDLVATRQASSRPPDSLFPGRRESSQVSARRGRGGRRRLWFFQATETELKVLDQLQTTSGARSRSELVSTAVEAYLLVRRRKSR